MELLNKVAIITGAARGIGFEIAQCFAEGGASVILVDRAGAETAATRLAARGLDASFRTLDITDMEAVGAAVADVVEKKARIDILVNNAGIIARGSFADLSREQWLRVMDVNVNGNFYLSKAVIPHMIGQRRRQHPQYHFHRGQDGRHHGRAGLWRVQGGDRYFDDVLGTAIGFLWYTGERGGPPRHRDRHERRVV